MYIALYKHYMSMCECMYVCGYKLALQSSRGCGTWCENFVNIFHSIRFDRWDSVLKMKMHSLLFEKCCLNEAHGNTVDLVETLVIFINCLLNAIKKYLIYVNKKSKIFKQIFAKLNSFSFAKPNPTLTFSHTRLFFAI